MAEQKPDREESAAEETPRQAQEKGSLDLVIDVPLRLTVEVGGARMRVRDLLQLDKGSVVELDRNTGEPCDVLVNGRLLARGEVTLVDERMAVRIVDVLRDGPPEGGSL